jgi:hypothetical protein
MRVYPMMVIVCAVAIPFMPPNFFVRTVLLYDASGYIFWTIPAEMEYYLIIIVFALSITFSLKFWSYTLSAYSILVGLCYFYIWRPQDYFERYPHVMPNLVIFYCGSFLAVLLNKYPIDEKLKLSKKSEIALDVFAWMLFLFILSVFVQGHGVVTAFGEQKSFFLHSLPPSLGITLGMTIGILEERLKFGTFASFFNLKLLAFCGKIR